MKDIRQQILSTYDAQAATLSAQYQSVQSGDVLAGLVTRLKRRRALDIACGNGRDAKWLAGQGFVVDAVDGAPGMIAEAQKTNADANVTYAVDLMPELRQIREKIRQGGEKYDLIVMSAAWMHLDAPSRGVMFQTLCDLAKPGAVMFITLRHGPAPADRPMYAVSAAELRDMAADFLIHFEHITDGKADKLGRGEVWWDSVSLQIPEHHADSLPIYRDVMIHSAKNTSYKLGFTHCFLEMIRNHPDLVTEADDARYAVPLGPILPHWIRLYDGLASAGLAQIRPNRKLADPINATRRFAAASAGVTAQDFQPETVFEGVQADCARRKMNIARKVIVEDGPVRFITRPHSRHPLFHYVPPVSTGPDSTLALDPHSLSDGYGHLLVARDLVHAGRDYAPLIDAGVIREWVRFNSRLAGDHDPALVKSSLEKVMKLA